MKTFIISYDLHKPGRDYSTLIDFLKKESPTYWHHIESMCIVKNDSTAVKIRDAIKKKIDGNDDVIVIELTCQMWATYGFSKRATDWLQKQL